MFVIPKVREQLLNLKKIDYPMKIFLHHIFLYWLILFWWYILRRLDRGYKRLHEYVKHPHSTETQVSWQIVWGLLIQGHWVKCHPPGTSGTHQVLASVLTDWLARRPLSMQLETQKDSLSHKPVAVENTTTLLSCLEHMGFIERRAVWRWKICRRWDIMWHEKVKGNWGSRLRMKGRRERGCKGIVVRGGKRGGAMTDTCLTE